MMLGGFLKQMNDAIRYNRDLLGKRKSPKELYREEIKNRTSSYDNSNLKFVRIRVAERLKRNRIKEFIVQATAIAILIFLVVGLIWFIRNTNFTWTRVTPNRYENKSGLFTTVIYHEKNGLDFKVDYFIAARERRKLF